MKICSRCKESKQLSSFYNDRTQKGGKSRRCKDCAKQVSRSWRLSDEGRAKEKWRQASRKYQRSKVYLKKYGITEEYYFLMLDAQGGCCAVCRIPAEASRGRNPGRLVIDHDHITGVVRGLLCSPCNTAIGLFQDSPTLLKSAENYLLKNKP